MNEPVEKFNHLPERPDLLVRQVTELLAVNRPSVQYEVDNIVAPAPSTVRETDSLEVAEKKRAYEAAVNRGRELTYGVMKPESQKKFEVAYRSFCSKSQDAFEAFEDYIKSSSRKGVYPRLSKKGQDRRDQVQVKIGLATLQEPRPTDLLEASAIMSEAYYELAANGAVRNDFRSQLENGGWNTQRQRGFMVTRGKDSISLANLVRNCGVKITADAVTDVAVFADELHSQQVRHLITSGLATLELAGVNLRVHSSPIARRCDPRPFVEATMRQLRNTIDTALDVGMDSIGPKLDEILTNVRNKCEFLLRQKLSSEEAEALGSWSELVDTYMATTNQYLDTIFGNSAYFEPDAAEPAPLPEVIVTDSISELDPSLEQAEGSDGASAGSESEQLNAQVDVEKQRKLEELSARLQQYIEQLQTLLQPFLPSKNTLRKYEMHNLLHELQVGYENPDTHVGFNGQAGQDAYEVVGTLFGLQNVIGTKSAAEAKAYVQDMVQREAQLLQEILTTRKELTTLGKNGFEPVTILLRKSTAWLAENRAAFKDLLSARLAPGQAKQYAVLLDRLFIPEQESAVVELPVDEPLSKSENEPAVAVLVEPTPSDDWQEDEMVEISQLPPLQIDEALVGRARQLDIVAFEPGRDRYERVKKDIIGLATKEELPLIEWWRIRLLDQIAEETGGELYRTLPGTFGERLPWYAAHIAIANQTVAVLEHPVHGNATYLIFDEAPGYWMQVIENLYRNEARAIGARQVIHPDKDMPSRLRLHKRNVQNQMQDLLNVRR